MRFLRTNTAVRVTVGPFFDKTDGVTPETGLTVTSCKLTLMVDDANVPTLVLDANATASGGNNDMVHVTGDDAGFYDLELTAANLNYVGRAMLAITDAATHCPVFHEFMILPAVVYDSMVLGTDLFQVDVQQSLGVAVTNSDGTAQAGGASTITLATGASSTDDYYNGQSISIVGGTGAGQKRVITDYVGSTRVATVSRAWATNPDNTSTYLLEPGEVDVASVARTAQTAGDLAALITTVDDYLDTEVAAIKAKTDSLTFTKALELDVNVQSWDGDTVPNSSTFP